MLGQPVSMLIPEVVGFKLHGKLPPGATATDLVLTVTEMLRKKKVVGKFVEFYGSGPVVAAARRSRDDRATWRPSTARRWASSPSTPRRSSTCASPAAASSTSRSSRRTRKEQGLFRTDDTPDPVFTDTLELDLGDGRAEPRRPEPSAGSRAAQAREADVPRRAQGRSREAGHAGRQSQLRSRRRRSARRRELSHARDGRRRRGRAGRARARRRAGDDATAQTFTLRHGAVVIAAITSCTNTSNPSVMLAAGLLARNAVAKGLDVEAVGEDVARARARRS